MRMTTWFGPGCGSGRSRISQARFGAGATAARMITSSLSAGTVTGARFVADLVWGDEAG
jgi:hypothetical protein